MIEDRKQNLENNKRVVFNNRLSDWREIRDTKLKDSDLKFLLYLEEYINSLPTNNDTKKLKDLISLRQELRDITNWNNFDSIENEFEMMDYLPDILR